MVEHIVYTLILSSQKPTLHTYHHPALEYTDILFLDRIETAGQVHIITQAGFSKKQDDHPGI